MSKITIEQWVEMRNKYFASLGGGSGCECAACIECELTASCRHISVVTSEELYISYMAMKKKVESEELKNLKTDDPVWVRDNALEIWKPRHFHSISESGLVRTYANGNTAHSSSSCSKPGILTWNMVSLNNPYGGE